MSGSALRRKLLPAAAAVLALTWALARPSAVDQLTFHHDPQRTGWSSAEHVLTAPAISGSNFGLLWRSEPFESASGRPARSYASPLHISGVKVTAAPYGGRTLNLILAATSTGFVYAVNAAAVHGVKPGTIVWRTSVGEPCLPGMDALSMGVMSTPVIDAARRRLYVVSCVSGQHWRAFALDIASGRIEAGWPVQLERSILVAPGIDANPPSSPEPGPIASSPLGVQRGALNLSRDGRLLYVTFGESAPGWVVAVDTVDRKVTGAFGSVAMPRQRSGGIWGTGGAVIDSHGAVFVATGTGFQDLIEQPHNWVQSVLKFSMVGGAFRLVGTYTPFNYCATATYDIDLGSGGLLLLPALDTRSTGTPELLALGGKQGNVYLVDRARMPGGTEARQPCSTDSSTDLSLLSPADQPQFGRRGPLNVFGPYTEETAAVDQARSRSVPAYFRDKEGISYLFVTGTTKRTAASTASVTPSLARLRLDLKPGQPAYLEIDRLENETVLANPGSPIVTGQGANAVVWILDTNGPRSALLSGPAAPRPVLYAFSASTLRLLWKSAPDELSTGGKYNEPAVVNGMVFVSTDRIEAFGLLPADMAAARQRAARDAQAAAAAPQAGAASTSSPTAPPEPAALYQERCLVCHSSRRPGVPQLEVIGNYPHERIVKALTEGVMRSQAAELSAAQIDELATFLNTITRAR